MTAGRSRTSGCGSAKGRSSSTQPSGVAQRSQSSPGGRDRSDGPQREGDHEHPGRSPIAMRLVGASWLVSAPTPANTGMTEMIASAR